MSQLTCWNRTEENRKSGFRSKIDQNRTANGNGQTNPTVICAVILCCHNGMRLCSQLL